MRIQHSTMPACFKTSSAQVTSSQAWGSVTNSALAHKRKAEATSVYVTPVISIQCRVRSPPDSHFR